MAVSGALARLLLLALFALGARGDGEEYLAFSESGSALSAEVHVRVRRAADNTSTTPAPTKPPTTKSPLANATIIYDSHIYYKSTIILERTRADNYLRAFQRAFNIDFRRHQILSNAHRIAVQVKMSFDFLFYGHVVNKVTIATGGFLYMSHFLHRYLTYSQYIAPLMADFDTGIGSGDVRFADTGSAFYVLWENVQLKNQRDIGSYTFEVVLHKNGTIVFGYHKIPAPLSAIATSGHKLQVGVADAFYEDEDHPTDPSKFNRKIKKYHTVNISIAYITSKTVIILHPMTTCVEQTTCNACLTTATTFDCAWCSAVDRCSSGTDRLKQEWERKKCHQVNTKSDCPVTAVEAGVIVLIVLIVIVLLFAIGSFTYWVYYAYTHPATPSGMWLMEHRPSVLASKFAAWRRGPDNAAADIYRVDA